MTTVVLCDERREVREDDRCPETSAARPRTTVVLRRAGAPWDVRCPATWWDVLGHAVGDVGRHEALVGVGGLDSFRAGRELEPFLRSGNVPRAE